MFGVYIATNSLAEFDPMARRAIWWWWWRGSEVRLGSRAWLDFSKENEIWVKQVEIHWLVERLTCASNRPVMVLSSIQWRVKNEVNGVKKIHGRTQLWLEQTRLEMSHLVSYAMLITRSS